MINPLETVFEECYTSVKTVQEGFLLIETFKRLRHELIIPLYGIIYMIWFAFLEKTVIIPEYIIHSGLDDLIPFIEIFVIPYLLWFVYVAVSVLYFMWKDRREFHQLIGFLMIGMSLFLIISSLFPNGHDLRPATFPRNNIFTEMVAGIYAADDSNNILPSIHVYNSIACWSAIRNSRFLKDRKPIRAGACILTWSIVLSTVFIKQHSVIDLISGVLLSGIVYPIFYCPASPVYYRKIITKTHP